MTDVDYNIWLLVMNVIGTDLDKGMNEEDILKEVNKITHGMVDYFALRREIARQRRMVIN